MEITAKMVNDLRQSTGAGMMECKSALKEAAGNMDEAVKILRKKGLAAAAKKAGRAATEGLVSAKVHAGAGVLLEVNCETDFVAKTEEFQILVAKLSERISVHEAFGDTAEGDVAALAALSSPTHEGSTIGEALSHMVARIGENIQIRRFARWTQRPGETFSTYVHGNGRIGVLVGMAGPEDLARDIAMHVAAAEPRFATRQSVPAEILDAEREIAKAQAAASGKPAAVAEKIAEGKLEKYYQEAVLVEQAYIRDDKKTVGAEIRSRAGDAAPASVRFARFKLGEGLARKENDFAAEVAAQTR